VTAHEGFDAFGSRKRSGIITRAKLLIKLIDESTEIRPLTSRK
jgi:hypothetical protein